MPTVETVLSPSLLTYYGLEGKTAVIIDILRATTSICHAFHNGARLMVPVATPEECLAFRPANYLCAGERNGVQLEGFDMGNSPEGFDSSRVKNREIAITTTNGTYAMLESRSAETVLIGSFINISKLCNEVVKLNQDVVLVCAGWKNKVNLEDTLFAGAVARKLAGEFETNCDSTLMAVDLWDRHSGSLDSLVRKSSHAMRFEKLGIDDIPFCLQLDTCEVVPVFKDGKIEVM